MESSDHEARSRVPVAALARMQTGAKLFLILVGALLPLALIALLITIQSMRTAGAEARARLRSMAEESSAVTQTALTSHAAQLRQALTALEADPAATLACERITATFESLANAQFSIVNGAGKILCGQRFTVAGAAVLGPSQLRAKIVDSGLSVRIGGHDGASATAFYPAAVLSTIARPNGFVPDYGLDLLAGGERLALRRLPDGGPFDLRESARGELDIGGLALDMSVPGARITSPIIITAVLLVVMWIAAAAISWFVVDILLIRPLRRLRASVGAYQPGELIDVGRVGEMPAQEIRELGETFREISRTVQAHEADLAEGLVRQTKLTREVHHRVKNNLQVIASLINFHARGAKSAEASEAYASIQRRVDALAVVHRNHYAELEENRGISLRPLISELASSLRGSAPDNARRFNIDLELETLNTTQDAAVALAFFTTEVIESAMLLHPEDAVRLTLTRINDLSARYSIAATMLTPETVDDRPQFERIISGLAKQLRSPLEREPGRYSVVFPVFPPREFGSA